MLNAWDGANEKFDRIYSCSALQWAKDPVDVLKKWRQALRPEGRGLVSLFVGNSLREFSEGCDRFLAIEIRSVDFWLEAYRAAGFEVRRYNVLERQLQFGSALEALRSLHDIGAIEERRMGAAKLRSFLRERDAAYLKEGCFPLSWEALKVEVG